MIFVQPKSLRSMVVILLSLSAQVTLAVRQPVNSLYSTLQNKGYMPLITLTVGPDFVNAGRAQTLTLLPPFQNHYTSTNNSQTVVDGGFFLGVERSLFLSNAQFGLSGYVDSTLSPKGHVWQFGLPKFDNFTYGYHIDSVRVMFTNKLLTALSGHPTIHPYLSWEIGAAFNRASSYQETPITPLAIPLIPFSNHSQSTFAWGAGLGIDYTLNQHVRAGVGYQFANLGSASLGATTVATTIQTLSVSHVYTNQLRFQLTYQV